MFNYVDWGSFFFCLWKSLLPYRAQKRSLDQIAFPAIEFLEAFNYKEKVLLVGKTGPQRAIPKYSNFRPSSSDAIFSGSVLNNIISDFSQIYVLIKKKKLFQLDVSNPIRVSLLIKLK